MHAHMTITAVDETGVIIEKSRQPNFGAAEAEATALVKALELLGYERVETLEASGGALRTYEHPNGHALTIHLFLCGC